MVLQRYRAKAELGKGSFGTVYLTEGRRDKKTYVVKVRAHRTAFSFSLFVSNFAMVLLFVSPRGFEFACGANRELGSCFGAPACSRFRPSPAATQVVDNLRENNLKVQEIRVMMHLKHRNIVEMCDFYTSNNQARFPAPSDAASSRSLTTDTPFSIAQCSRRASDAPPLQLCIVMDYADGGDLRREIVKARNTKTHISEELITIWMMQASPPSPPAAVICVGLPRAAGGCVCRQVC